MYYFVYILRRGVIRDDVDFFTVSPAEDISRVNLILTEICHEDSWNRFKLIQDGSYIHSSKKNRMMERQVYDYFRFQTYSFR